MANEREGSPMLLKIVFGMVSAGFTITILLLSNMWARMDRMEEKYDKSTCLLAAHEVFIQKNSAQLEKDGKCISQLYDICRDIERQYGLKAEEIHPYYGSQK
jgi:hypothetical protein